MARGKIRWIKRQVERLRKAVSSFNAAVTRMEKSGKYDHVPNKVDMQTEMGRIDTRDQLRQRLVELGRILKKNKPDAQDVVQAPDGSKVPRYLITEARNAKRAVNRQRQELRDTIYPDWDNMKPWDKAADRSDRNIQPLKADYWSAEDLEYLWGEKYVKDEDYLQNYIATMRSISAWDEVSQELEDIIRDITKKPRALRQIFEEQHDETEIYYLYPVSKEDLTPFQIRYNRVIRFWNEQRTRWLGEAHAYQAPKPGDAPFTSVGKHVRGMKL